MSCVILDREAASCGGQYKLFAAAVHSLTHSFINIPPPGRSIGQWATPQLPGAELMMQCCSAAVAAEEEETTVTNKHVLIAV